MTDQAGFSDIPEGEVQSESSKVSKFVDNLPCPITDEEYRTLTVERAKLDQKILDAETRKKIVNKQVASEIEESKGRIAEINDALITGSLIKEVDCQRVYDYGSGYVVVMRMDTGDVIRERKISEVERQRDIFESETDET
jgi:hypothetical protein